MTPLAALLSARIAATGPIPISEYMAECLLHPEHGYYTTRPPFGQAGDFTTAPEISQMFGELVGLRRGGHAECQGAGGEGAQDLLKSHDVLLVVAFFLDPPWPVVTSPGSEPHDCTVSAILCNAQADGILPYRGNARHRPPCPEQKKGTRRRRRDAAPSEPAFFLGILGENGAAGVNRTPDPTLTKGVLYP